MRREVDGFNDGSNDNDTKSGVNVMHKTTLERLGKVGFEKLHHSAPSLNLPVKECIVKVVNIVSPSMKANKQVTNYNVNHRAAGGDAR